MIEAILNRLVNDADLRQELRTAARSTDPVSGLTHRHYKYPARFSPQFVGTVIERFSKPGDVVLDPYMGGGTTVLEAFARNRRAVGTDLNSLAVFVTKVKSTTLDLNEIAEVRAWAIDVIPSLSYSADLGDAAVVCERRTRNLTLPRARPVKKLVALALASLDLMDTTRSRDFIRCALLNTAQWALNGRRTAASLDDFRSRLTKTIFEMLNGTIELGSVISKYRDIYAPVLNHGSAAQIQTLKPFDEGRLADLVVTSPPYPGVHVLYHRWQVDGRRETPAPYWIANCLDGQGAAYYNFGARQQPRQEDYFAESLRTLKSIRSVMRDGAPIVQMIAFSRPRSQLRRYLENMRLAGFTEVVTKSNRAIRTWRSVPGRNWHANLKGQTESAREVVLTHVAD